MPFHTGPPELMDVVEAEKDAISWRKNKEKDKQEQLDYMKSMGLM